ncbi:hypothetical protein CMO93_02620 [Candidatus Woesearchaeota archaeon]|nr:hypothetical protein [Candidatus Woesearchaeota archaeon]|tara:strand:+ start:15475 stop:19635 length:4161 start_codon:yes stop_codon:yes gene_type:complete
MEKEGKINTKFIVSVILVLSLSLLTLMWVFALDISLTYPVNDTINITTDRNMNFTFTPTWNLTGEVVGNCSVFTNFTGTWEALYEFNGTTQGAYNESSNISNATLSWANYTFGHDIGLMMWSVGCRNGTGSAAELNFTAPNRTLAIDTLSPTLVQTAEIFQGFNTSGATPTITINLTDINGTGVNLTSNGNNVTINISIYDVNDGTDSEIKTVSLNESGNLSCDVAGDSVTKTQCTVSFDNWVLSNGTKNITVVMTDRAGFSNESSFTFTVDQIAPLYDNLSIKDAIADAGVLLNNTPDASIAQGRAFFVVSNWSDNLTQPSEIRLQILNTSTSTWFTVNFTNLTPRTSGGWGNISYGIPTGHNIFAGRNISIRVNATDMMNNSNVSPVLLLMVNDTTKPTILVAFDLGSEQEGNRAVNGTNISDSTPTIVWNVTGESNSLRYVAIQVDSSLDTTCNLKQNYTSIGDKHTRAFINTQTNNSMTVSGTGSCEGRALSNGTHILRFTVEDDYGNSELYIHNFTVQTGEEMNISLGMVNTTGGHGTTMITVNNSNITSYSLLTFNVTLDGGVSTLKNMTWTSSCNTSLISTYTNSTQLTPFNTSNCRGLGGNRTVTLTATDHVGNSVTKLFGFIVDDVGPLIYVKSPTNGLTASGLVELNVSAFDQMNKVDSIAYYLDGSDTITNHTLNGTDALLATYQGENITFVGASVNFTVTGTHTIKFRVNDSLGTVTNSSVITFTQTGPITFSEINTSIESYLAQVFNDNLTNVSIKIKTDAGTYVDILATNDTDNTYQLLYEIGGTINVSLTEINGSAAIWNKINFTPFINNTPQELLVQSNWTNTVLNSTWFNSSIREFISDNNSYYGVVELPFNVSGTIATAQEFWWIPDEDVLSTRTNISQCGQTNGGDATFSAARLTPCWNYSKRGVGKTEIYVPHFSIVLVVNDSTPPTVIKNAPASAQGVSGFIPNITVSSDAVSCEYILNITNLDNTSATTNVSSAVTPSTSGDIKICTWPEIRFKNGAYNITFNVTDSNGNINLTSSGVDTEGNFTVSDSTIPNTPNGSRVSISVGTTSATITITGINESVNANVSYGTILTSLGGTPALETDYSKSQSVSLTDLSADTFYYFNVTVCDYNENCVKNGTFNFTTSAAAAAAAAASSSSSGGGGGGAAAVSTVSDSQGQVWNTVPAGTSISINVDKATIAVTKVAVNNVKSALNNVELDVAALTDNPVSTEAAPKVYQYLKITKKNLANTDAGSFSVGFRVTKAWLTENGLASADVSLYRFADSQWNELTTKVTGTDSVYVNYEADTPGFSSFAVAVKGSVEVEEEAEEEAGEAEEGVEEAPEAVEKPKPVEAPGKAPTAWIIAAVVVILGIILIVMYQKKKQQGG